MKLILQAIKTLLNRLEKLIYSTTGALETEFETKISKTTDSLTSEINTVRQTAELAEKNATKAIADAASAERTAEGRMTKFKPTGSGALLMNAREGGFEGVGATVLGSDSIAGGGYCSAIGLECEAMGTQSVAIGSIAKATGEHSVSLGRQTTAAGIGSHAEGCRTDAIGDYSHAEGYETTASGDYSHAEGYETTASGNYAHAEGYQTAAYGQYQHVQGKFNIGDSEGKYAHIVGNGSGTSVYDAVRSNAHTLDWDGNAWFKGKVYVGGTSMDDATELGTGGEVDISGKLDKVNPTATGYFRLNPTEGAAIGDYSTALGKDCTASGSHSFATGIFSTAYGQYAHAEGEGTQCYAKGGHTEGFNTFANGNYAHAEGYQTAAYGQYQHVQGRKNVYDTEGRYAHIVGNGEIDGEGSNAHTLDWDGNAWFAGTVEGTALILKSSTEGSSKRFKITVDDSGTLSATELT